MRKRTSLRRWKARCRVGRTIPAEAIVDYSLHRWFRFKLLNPLADFYVADPAEDDLCRIGKVIG
jgi:hypothetical protein